MAKRQKPNAIQKATRKAIRETINNANSDNPQPITINLTIPIQINIPEINLNFFNF
jgi:hypothetical protein